MRIYKAIALIVTAVIILTVGEFTDYGLPSWSDAFGKPEAQSVHQPEPLPEGCFAVHIIDVGQGDATLLQCGAVNILIDAGENGQGRVIAEYFQTIGVERLDWMIATHPHSDHMGGMDDILELVGADNVMMPDIAEECIPENTFYTSVIDAIDSTDTPVSFAKSGDVFTAGDITIHVLHPSPGEYREDVNDVSLCLLVSCGEIDVLLCGDITYEVENELVEAGVVPEVELFHAIHHGSTLSNSEEIINAAKPDYAVISCGKRNVYGHPHSSVLQRLKNAGSAYYRTDEHGTIVFYFTDNGVEIKTEK